MVLLPGCGPQATGGGSGTQSAANGMHSPLQHCWFCAQATLQIGVGAIGAVEGVPFEGAPVEGVPGEGALGGSAAATFAEPFSDCSSGVVLSGALHPMKVKATANVVSRVLMMFPPARR
jgi:hypothetical protein